MRKRPLLTIKKLVFIEEMERLGRFLSALAALVLLATSPSAALRRAHRLFLGAKRPMAGEPRMTGYAHTAERDTCRDRLNWMGGRHPVWHRIPAEVVLASS